MHITSIPLDTSASISCVNIVDNYITTIKKTEYRHKIFQDKTKNFNLNSIKTVAMIITIFHLSDKCGPSMK